MESGVILSLKTKHLELILLFAILISSLIFNLQTTFSSPIVFGDEGFHTRMAQWIGVNREYPVWYPFEGSDLYREGFSRPPLWNIFEGSFYLIFGFSESIAKFLTPFIAFIIGLVVYLIGKRFYGSIAGLISAAVTITIPSFVTYSVLLYADMLFVLYFTLSILFVALSAENKSKKYLIVSGIFAALALLTKKPGYILLPTVGLFYLYMIFKEKTFSYIKNFLIYILVFAIIISPYFIRNYVFFETPTCELVLIGLYDDNKCWITFDYTPTYKFEGVTQRVGTEAEVYRLGLTNYFNFAYGNIWLVGLGFLGGLPVVFYKRRIPDILLLAAFIGFLFVFNLASYRAENTPRHTLAWVPIISLIVANYFSALYNYIKKYVGKIALIIVIIILIIGFQTQLEKTNVMKQVKRFSPTFFEACNWIKENLPVDALIATNYVSHTVYNCQRNVGGGGPDSPDTMLSGDLDLTLDRLKAHKVTHIFIQKFGISDKSFSESYNINYVQMLENNPKYFENIYETGPPINQCVNAGCPGEIIYKINYTNF